MQGNKESAALEAFAEMSTEQLDAILHRELHADTPDLAAICLILDVLWQREKDMPLELTPEMQRAWDKYRQDMARISRDSRKTARRRKLFVRCLSSAAVLVLAMMLLVPREANAGGAWEWLAQVTDSVLEYFTPADTESRILEYEFRTDNPGLQTLHDTVVEHGVDFPAVPMWLPGNMELAECRVDEAAAKRSIYANFVDGDESVVINYDIYNKEVAHSFEKDATRVRKKEIEGNQFAVVRNNERWTVVWGQDNIECSIFIDCREEDLDRMLRSIYMMEE